jgi:hypothetical protein
MCRGFQRKASVTRSPYNCDRSKPTVICCAVYRTRMFVGLISVRYHTNHIHWGYVRMQPPLVYGELSITREATICVATRELPSNIWSPKVYYRIHIALKLSPS